MVPSEPRYTVCDTYKAAAEAAEQLSRHSTVIVDCFGHNLGLPDGRLSVIAIGTEAASHTFLFDVLALDDFRHPQLAPLLGLLRRPDISKLCWDGRAWFYEIADTYAVLVEGLLDLQVAEVVHRRKYKKFGNRIWRHQWTMDYFKWMKAELAEEPQALDGIFRLYCLDHCAGLYRVPGVGGKNKELNLLVEEHGDELWMQRPLPDTLQKFASRNIEKMACLYARFVEKKKYLEDVDALKAISACYANVYPSRELRALHTTLEVTKFFPLDVLERPEGPGRYMCTRCEQMLSLSCFSTTIFPCANADADADSNPGVDPERLSKTIADPQQTQQGQLARLTFCRLCHLIARRRLEEDTGEWVTFGRETSVSGSDSNE